MVVFALLPAAGVANAAATMVGQALGAGDPDRAERSVWVAGFVNVLYLSATAAVFVLAAPGVVRLFGGDAAIGHFAVRALRTLALVNLLCFWVWEMPLVWLLARGPLGAQGVNVAATAAFCALAIVGAMAFRRGGWKTARV